MVIQFFNPLTALNYPTWLNFTASRKTLLKREIIDAIVSFWEGYVELARVEVPVEEPPSDIQLEGSTAPVGMDFLQGIVQVTEQ